LIKHYIDNHNIYFNLLWNIVRIKLYLLFPVDLNLIKLVLVLLYHQILNIYQYLLKLLLLSKNEEMIEFVDMKLVVLEYHVYVGDIKQIHHILQLIKMILMDML